MTTPAPAPAIPAGVLTQIRDEALGLLSTGGRPIPPDSDTAARVTVLAPRVLALIWHRLALTAWWADEAWPPLVIEAAAQATAEMYRRKDAPFGITGAWGQDGEPIRVARDPLAGVEYLLAPYVVSGSAQIA
jgi:hypothetical protein